MKKSIQTQINNINDALAWLKVNKPDQYEQRFLQLVNERCRLRKLAATELENPAIAAYGESQKGKSYVITNLLSDNGRPFTIKTPEREYDFVKEINPITNNVEATGVVTRFTTFANEPGRYNPTYPVLIKLLGMSEIATILCDGYHSDITDYQSYSDKELNDISTEIYEAYRERPELASPVIVEDDILDMKYYLQRCTGGSTQSLIRSPYFERIALIARRVEASEWSDIFAPLWHRNATLTRLFRRLSEALRNLSYARNVYLPVDAVLNTNQTLMSVQRINELGTADKSEDAAFTKVVIRSDSGDRIIERFDKSELSALCAEAVFKVEERFLNSELSYDMTMIADPAVRAKLPVQPFKKDIIRHTDLLDFPGARARNQLKEENLDKTDPKSSMTNDANVYLRGKVAYLFNRYSDSGLINILLFCHDNAQRNDDTLYITIENWVKQYVGETHQQRARTLKLTGGVSPFFLIATKFNIDMTMADANADDVANSRTAIDQRWADRFNIVLYKEVIHGNDAEWFKNWISEGETFKNTYLLRDYKYSGDTGKGNNLYTGFRETGREQKPAIDPVYYDRMRTSFIESPHTRKFFADPACSWDVAATQNNDGALYLFQQLAVAAANMEVTRRELTASTLKNIGKALYEILKGYYHANDAAAQLLQD
ncbi:MAG: putative virulence factor, partial [Muribaculaceae bacterium]|nr:putative virulence factor [Muribaculaceae bacterium]